MRYLKARPILSEVCAVLGRWGALIALIGLLMFPVLGSGCSRATEQQCMEACVHVEGVRGRKLRQCMVQCRAHGTAERADCLVAAGTPDEVDRCRER